MFRMKSISRNIEQGAGRDAAGPLAAVPFNACPCPLSGLSDVLEGLFRRQPPKPADPAGTAHAVVAEIAHHFGGRSVYFPAGAKRGASRHNDTRDCAIRHEANGNNTQELAARHGLTVRRVQQIVAEKPSLMRQDRQS